MSFNFAPMNSTQQDSTCGLKLIPSDINRVKFYTATQNNNFNFD